MTLPPGGHPRVASLALRAIHLQVARVSGSEEECGRKPESLYNITGLQQCHHKDGTPVEVLTYTKSLCYRPHSSSVKNRFRRADFCQLPPGGSDGRCRAGHPGRGVPTRIPSRRGDPCGRPQHHLPTTASLRGRQAVAISWWILQVLTPVPGDCHVGLRPPRNDVVISTRSF